MLDASDTQVNSRSAEEACIWILSEQIRRCEIRGHEPGICRTGSCSLLLRGAPDPFGRTQEKEEKMIDEHDNPMDEIGHVPTCRYCGSQRLIRKARAYWNPAAGLWQLESALDRVWCCRCEIPTSIDWQLELDAGNFAIRTLNDALRKNAEGNGEIKISSGVIALGRAFVSQVATAVREFDDFSEESDPCGEHDFGAVYVEGRKVLWKIDCFDLASEGLSQNPANPDVTWRVLTIMLAAEY